MARNPKVGLILEAKDQSAKGFGGFNSAIDSSKAKIKSFAQDFFFISEAAGNFSNMISSFTGPALEYEENLIRAAIAMDLGQEKMGAFERRLDKLRDTTVGETFSNAELAAGLKEIADEGHGVEGTFEVLTAAMDVSAATGKDLTFVVKMLESGLSAMGKESKDASTYGDQLITTWRKTGTEVDVLLTKTRQLAPAAKVFGLDMAGILALVGELGDKGVEEVNAMTEGFQMLVRGTGEGQKVLEKYGVEIRRTDGTVKSVLEVFQELADAEAEAAEIGFAFGSESSKIYMIMLENLESINATIKANTEAQGAAAKAAETYAKSAAGDMDKWNNAVKELKLELARGLLPALVTILNALKPILLLLADHPALIYAIVAAYAILKVALMAATMAHLGFNAAALANPYVAILTIIILLVTYLWQLEERFGSLTYAGQGLINVLQGIWVFLKKIGEAAQNIASFGGLGDRLNVGGLPGYQHEGRVQGSQEGTVLRAGEHYQSEVILRESTLKKLLGMGAPSGGGGGGDTYVTIYSSSNHFDQIMREGRMAASRRKGWLQPIGGY